MKPAWAWQFERGHLEDVLVDVPGEITPGWAWGDATGRGVKVAILDSGVDPSHPKVGPIAGGITVDPDPAAPGGVRIVEGPHEDVFGHGTACAAIIRAVAPDAEVYSVRVLNERLSGRGQVFAAGLRWAIERGIHVVNMSLSTGNRSHYGIFHRLVDEANFRRVMLVAAISNQRGLSFPAQFSGVFSVASHAGKDPFEFFVNPRPPAEWGAPGIDLRVAWMNGKDVLATGNSFATPHLAALVALILSKHPALTVFQMKTVLAALAANARSPA